MSHWKFVQWFFIQNKHGLFTDRVKKQIRKRCFHELCHKMVKSSKWKSFFHSDRTKKERIEKCLYNGIMFCCVYVLVETK